MSEAAEAYRAALDVFTRSDMPANWAMTQNNLGAALARLGELALGEAGLAGLNKAVDAYRAALEVFTRREMSANWAFTTENLALAEESVSFMARAPEPLRTAIVRVDEAIIEFEGMQAGYYVEKAKRNRERMLQLLNEIEGDC